MQNSKNNDVKKQTRKCIQGINNESRTTQQHKMIKCKNTYGRLAGKVEES